MKRNSVRFGRCWSNDTHTYTRNEIIIRPANRPESRFSKMYTLKDDDKWFAGRLHARLNHDCSLTTEGTCGMFDDLLSVYAETRDEQIGNDLKEMFGGEGN